MPRGRPFGLTQVDRRFKTDAPRPLSPETVRKIGPDHPAVLEFRTIFPSRVFAPQTDSEPLVNGKNSRKIGDRIIKGPWRGARVYTLTLEERYTCPRSCGEWFTCYGNGMQYARRWAAGPDLERQIHRQLEMLCGMVGKVAVRLHVLGDFYSVEYAERWKYWLRKHRNLHLFGFTAHDPDSAIGSVVHSMNSRFPSRCAIRYSVPFSARLPPFGATVLGQVPTADADHDGNFVCPAETGKTQCCGTCGLCWSPAKRNDSVIFVRHGPQIRTSKAKTKIAPAEVDPETDQRDGYRKNRAAAHRIEQFWAERGYKVEASIDQAGRLQTDLVNGWPKDHPTAKKIMVERARRRA